MQIFQNNIRYVVAPEFIKCVFSKVCGFSKEKLSSVKLTNKTRKDKQKHIKGIQFNLIQSNNKLYPYIISLHG